MPASAVRATDNDDELVHDQTSEPMKRAKRSFVQQQNEMLREYEEVLLILFIYLIY